MHYWEPSVKGPIGPRRQCLKCTNYCLDSGRHGGDWQVDVTFGTEFVEVRGGLYPVQKGHDPERFCVLPFLEMLGVCNAKFRPKVIKDKMFYCRVCRFCNPGSATGFLGSPPPPRRSEKKVVGRGSLWSGFLT